MTTPSLACPACGETPAPFSLLCPECAVVLATVTGPLIVPPLSPVGAGPEIPAQPEKGTA